jgi:hypothetical protein
MRHDPGLAASPPVRYILKMARSGISSPLLCGGLRLLEDLRG